MTGDPAFLSAPPVVRNPVGPLVTGEEALLSKADIGSSSPSQGDLAGTPRKDASLQPHKLQTACM